MTRYIGPAGWDALKDGPAKDELRAQYDADRRARLEDERSARLARELKTWEGIVSEPVQDWEVSQ